MTFAVHTFETKASEVNTGFAFHESLGEGQELYFLGQFHEKDKNPRATAESIFGAIVDTMQSSQNFSDPYQRFEEALKSANLEAQKNRQNLAAPPDVIVAFFDFQNLYLTQSGTAEAYLVRQTAVSQISETLEAGTDLFMNILSGQVAVNDTIVFANSRLLHSITNSQLADLFSRTDFDESCRMLRHELSMKAEESLLVTTIGIGKKSNTTAGGFLSKVVSRVTAPKAQPLEPDPEEPTPDTTLEEGLESEHEEPKILEEEYDDEDEPPVLEFKEEDLEEISETEPLPIKRPDPTSFQVKLPKFSGNLNLPPRKKLMTIAGAVLGLFIIVMSIRGITGYESAETAEMREKLSIAREALQDADSFLIQGDRTSAGERLEKAQSAVQIVLNAKKTNFRSDAQFLLADIQDKLLQVENARKTQAQLLADLTTKNENINAVGMLELRGNLFAYDLKQVYKTVRNIVESGLQISEKENVIAAASREDQNTLLFLTDGPRLIEYRNSVISPMNTSDTTWKSGIDLKTYGRYAYVLDPVENQIWKYERQRDNYSGSTAYNQGSDLSRAVSFSIDGAIYILSDDGTIQKLFRGQKQEFSFRELPSQTFSGKNLKLYTTPELDFLYVLDPENSRILVFTKGDRFATYKKQVLFDLPNARDFVVDDAGQKVNVITDDKIYEFAL
jgi:hypothetical protein